jgi:hypothetical protein
MPPEARVYVIAEGRIPIAIEGYTNGLGPASDKPVVLLTGPERDVQ